MQRVTVDRALDFVAHVLAEQRTCVALTGAGISVPSGIPDFRSKGGLWEKYDPAEHATLAALISDPARAWRMLAEQQAAIQAARPNPAHEALALLERLGVLYGIITQNIDGLHQEAGSACVVELHGSFRRLRCLGCSRTFAPTALEELGMPPLCSCGQVIRPDVVLFGETIPREVLAAAVQLVRTCSLMLVVGTSAAVPPAAAIPQFAQSGGALVVEINLVPTPLTDWCEVTILGDAARTLPQLAERVVQLVK